jgi:hypothetical protein
LGSFCPQEARILVELSSHKESERFISRLFVSFQIKEVTALEEISEICGMTGIYFHLLTVSVLTPALVRANEITLNLPLIPQSDIRVYGFEPKISLDYKALHNSVGNPVVIEVQSKNGSGTIQIRQFTPQFRRVVWNIFIFLDPLKTRTTLEMYGFKETSIFIHISPTTVANVSSPVYDAIVLGQRLDARVHFLFRGVNDTWSNFIVPKILNPRGDPLLALLETIPSSSTILLDLSPNLSFHGNKVGVDVMKGERCSVKIRHKLCNKDYGFVATAAKFFNFTSVYMEYPDIDQFLMLARLHVSIHSYISKSRYVTQYRIQEFSASCFLGDAEDYFLLYCENEMRTSRFSSSYWTSPLDNATWVLFLVSLTLSAAITSLRARRRFIVSFLELIGTLVRQASNRRMLYLQVVFCFMGFFITAPYESVVTSDVTVPLPPLVAKNLRELIVDRGYKILFPIVNISELAGYDLHEFSNGFEKYNLTHVFDSSLQAFDFANDTSDSCLARKKNNLATDVGKSELSWKVMTFQAKAKGRFCHVIPEPFFRRYFAMLVRGKGHERIVRFLSLTREVGILAHSFNNENWFKEYWNKRLARKSVTSVGSEGLQLNEKVQEIFLAFVAGICFSTMHFFIEVIWCLLKPSGAAMWSLSTMSTWAYGAYQFIRYRL